MNEPMTEDRLDDLRRTPRQADVDDVADLVSEVDRLRASLTRALEIADELGTIGNVGIFDAELQRLKP